MPYIDKEDLLAKAKAKQNGVFAAPVIVNLIEKAPEVDVVEVKHGEWDVGGINPHNNTVGNWHCSVCKGVSLKDSNYCPKCGAKMDLKEGAEE